MHPIRLAAKLLSPCLLVLLLIATVGTAKHHSTESPPTDSRIWVVNQTHPNASDQGDGTDTHPFKTISHAAELAGPGDTVWVRAGIYRERVTPARGGEPNRPITYQAAPGEQVIVKGSEIWTLDPKPLAGADNVYTGVLDPAWFGDDNPYRIRLKRMSGDFTLGQVFIDGRPVTEVDSMAQLRATANTWMINADADRLYVHFPDAPTPPLSRLVEVTVRDRNFAPHIRGLGYIQVKGFIFEHAANQFPSGFWASKDSPQAGAVSTRSGHHWVIEDNVIRYAKSLGLDCGSEGRYDIEGDQPTPEGQAITKFAAMSLAIMAAAALPVGSKLGQPSSATALNATIGWVGPRPKPAALKCISSLMAGLKAICCATTTPSAFGWTMSTEIPALAGMCW